MLKIFQTNICVVVLLINFVHSILNLDITQVCATGGSYCFPRVVWTYWTGSGIPDDINEMLNVTRESLTHITFCFLTDGNLSDFLHDRMFPQSFQTLHPRGKADYVRVCLLEKYGGVWIDASMIINSEREMEWIILEAVKFRSVFVGSHPQSQRRAYIFEAAIMGCPQNSSYMKVLKIEFDEMIGSDPEDGIYKICEYLTSQGYANHRSLCKYAKKQGSHSYLPWIDLIFHQVAFRYPNLSSTILFLPSSLSPTRLSRECNFSFECEKCRLLHDAKTRDIPFIHLHRDFREVKKWYYKEGLYLNNDNCHLLHQKKKKKEDKGNKQSKKSDEV